MWKKLIVLGIIILFFGVGAIPSTGYEVNKKSITPLSTGSTLYVGGSGEGNYTSIQDAINDAVDGDTVFVYNGTYYENIIVNTAINLVGDDMYNTVIDGRQLGIPVFIDKSYVNITSFTIHNCSNGDGIKVDNKIKINISKCIFIDNFVTNSDGVFFKDVFDSYITNCFFYNNCQSGITLENCENIIIDNCTFENNYYGIFIHFSSDNISITECNLNYNNLGISVVYSKNIEIYQNVISENIEYGIFITDSRPCSKTIIHNNTISENGNGNKYLEGGILIQKCIKNVIIKYNTLSSNNPHGIYFVKSYGNIILKNNILNNSINFYFLTSIRSNHWNSNFWDDWIGLKIKLFEIFPKIIIGSYNFKIPLINFDWHPAKEPYDI